ncbi:MAG: GIY-YIG nuclease family protein, partial [Lactococcus sp.]
MKSYFVYVLRCADDTLYCGYTDDVTKRLETHNSGKGAKYTKARRPLQLLTSVEFSD